jgi:hypothetical protein
LKELEGELRALRATEVVIQVALTEEEIRLDGWPRADAKPSHPGVIISFDSKWGPQRYFGDNYADGYKANVRAIGLGLKALRAVDRYGITRRGEQYTGFKALTTGLPLDGPGRPTTRRGAAQLLAGIVGREVSEIMAGGELSRRLIAEALRRSHPDHGGTAEQLDIVLSARKILEGG